MLLSSSSDWPSRTLQWHICCCCCCCCCCVVVFLLSMGTHLIAFLGLNILDDWATSFNTYCNYVLNYVFGSKPLSFGPLNWFLMYDFNDIIIFKIFVPAKPVLIDERKNYQIVHKWLIYANLMTCSMKRKILMMSYLKKDW